VWTAGLLLTGLPVVWRTVRGMASGRFAADLVAMLAIVAAVALQQPLPGLIVVLMQTGGEALERAEGRASEAVRGWRRRRPGWRTGSEPTASGRRRRCRRRGRPHRPGRWCRATGW
jgi:cation transport ATPase